MTRRARFATTLLLTAAVTLGGCASPPEAPWRDRVNQAAQQASAGDYAGAEATLVTVEQDVSAAHDSDRIDAARADAILTAATALRAQLAALRASASTDENPAPTDQSPEPSTQPSRPGEPSTPSIGKTESGAPEDSPNPETDSPAESPDPETEPDSEPTSEPEEEGEDAGTGGGNDKKENAGKGKGNSGKDDE